MFILHFRNMAVWRIFTKTRQPRDHECNSGMVLRAEEFRCGAKDIANGLEEHWMFSGALPGTGHTRGLGKDLEFSFHLLSLSAYGINMKDYDLEGKDHI